MSQERRADGVASVAICDTTEDPDLAAFWQSLERTGCTPMQQYIWSQACYETLPLIGQLHLVVVRTGPEGGAVAPLVRRRGPLRRLERLGSILFEPSDLVYSDADALGELATILARREPSLLLSRIPADTSTVRVLQDAYRGHGKVFVRPAMPFPRIVLNDAWREPEKQLNAGHRSDLRRAVRNAEKIGPLRSAVLSPTPEQLGPLLDEALEVEAANWKGRAGTAITMDELRGPFYRRYAAAASRSGCLRLCFLHVGETAVAMQFAIECGGSFWLLKIGYREEFSRCSPGMLLVAETVRYAAARGLGSYEFLGAAESWTRVWTKDERPSLTVRAYPMGARGMSALAVDSLGVVARKLKPAAAPRKMIRVKNGNYALARG